VNNDQYNIGIISQPLLQTFKPSGIPE